ncbi:metallophosphatase (plasmid) [Picosynechococcus sp. PCC 11901]|uniref:metallophosphoesterase family protein n=2 Tax=Picosynechococcus sp. PCC 11901 TaxID=2579791 RepID=UPI0010FBC2A4|nr:metallophosphatase [Picosynechococcus sp. PCC 11901]QCS51117.1 metallophosphatase [Picosynechococcus sp. PCC 11901]
MMQWAILSGIEGNLAAYEAVLQDIRRQTPKVTELYILGDLIDGTPAGNAVVERIRHPKQGELMPQVCKGAWEEQCLIVRGLAAEPEENPFLAEKGGAMLKQLWDHVPLETVQWFRQLHFGFAELDCLLLHGSSLTVFEALTPNISPLVLLDRLSRTGSNRLFCGRSGQTFQYQVSTGKLAATVTTLDQTAVSQNYTIGDSVGTAARLIVGVGSVGRVPKQATYTLYNPNTDQVTFRTVRYGTVGFG